MFASLPPANSELSNLLSVLSDPQASKKLAEQAALVQSQKDQLDAEKASFASERSKHLADIQDKSAAFETLSVNLDTRQEQLEAKQASLVLREESVSKREHDVSIREDKISQLETKHKDIAFDLDNRQKEINDKYGYASRVTEDAHRLKRDYEERLTKLRGLIQ